MARSIVDVIINVVTGNANKDVKELDKNVDNLTKSTKEAEKGAKSAGGAFSTIGNAVKSLGIITVIASAFNFFKETLLKNQKVADSLAAVFNTISTIINTLIDIFNEVTAQVSKSTNGFDALGKVLTGILTIAITPLKLAFDGIKLVIKEVQLAWENSWFGDKDQSRIKELTQEINEVKDSLAKTGTDAVQAGKDIYNNFGAAVQSVGDVVSGVVDKASKVNVKAIYEQSKATIALQNNAKIAEAQLQGLVEKYDRQAEQLRQIRDDDTKSLDERIAANDKLGKVLDEQEKAQKALALQRVAAAKAELAQNKENVDLQAALIQAQNEVAAVEAQVAGFRSEQLTNGNALRKEQLDLDKSLAASNNKIALDQKKNNAELILDEVTKLETKKALLKEEGDLELKRLQDNIKATKEGTTARVQAEIEYNEKKAELANQEGTLEQQLSVARLNNRLNEIKTSTEARVNQIASEEEAIKNAFENRLISEKEYNEKLLGLSDERKKIAEDEFNAVIDSVNKIKDGFSNVAAEFGRNVDFQQQQLKASYDKGLISQEQFNAQSEELAKKKAKQEKNLALFNLAVDTGVAIAGIVRQASRNPTNLTPFQLIIDIAARSAAVLTNILKARNAINQAKLTGSSSVGGLTAGGGGATQAPLQPQTPLVNTRTQLDSQTIQQLGSATNRAYVVESDVTNSQERIRRINRAARLS